MEWETEPVTERKEAKGGEGIDQPHLQETRETSTIRRGRESSQSEERERGPHMVFISEEEGDSIEQGQQR